MNKWCPSICILIFLFFLSIHVKAQICNPSHSLYFESGEYKLNLQSKKNILLFLDSLRKVGDHYLEIQAYTDSIGSEVSNLILSSKRAQEVEKYIQMSSGKMGIKVLFHGEFSPKYTNSDEENRSKNRRVDIFSFPLANGKVVLKSPEGFQYKTDTGYFGPCGICNSNLEIQSYSTDDQAAENGIEMYTNDGVLLTTGGMFQFQSSCESEDSDTQCKPMEVRIPAAQLDPLMRLYVSYDSAGKTWWKELDAGDLKFENGEYVLTLPCYNRISQGLINLDKPKCSAYVHLPKLDRSAFPLSEFQRHNERNHEDSILLVQRGWQWGRNQEGCPILSKIYQDQGIGSKQLIYRFKDSLNRYITSGNGTSPEYIIPLSAYKIHFQYRDTQYYVKYPWKYRRMRQPKVYVPDADSSLRTKRVKGLKRTFRSQVPVNPFYFEFRIKKKDSETGKRRTEKILIDPAKLKLQIKIRKGTPTVYLRLKRKDFRKVRTF